MAKLPRKAPKVYPVAWITEGRWAGASPCGARETECDRALWFSARWATPCVGPPEDLHKRLASAITIISGPMPDGVGQPIDEVICPRCPHRGPCGGGPIARGCRTCRHVVADHGWFCSSWNDTPDIDVQRVGCDRWEQIEC